MNHNPMQEPDDWEHNIANPKVREALETTFELAVTGMDIQMIGASLEQMKLVLAQELASGGKVLRRADTAEGAMGCIRGIQQIDKFTDRLADMWDRAVRGQMIGLGDMPPDPFGKGAGPYL